MSFTIPDFSKVGVYGSGLNLLSGGRITGHGGAHGLPDPAGVVKGSKEWHEKHDKPPPPPEPKAPPPPPPPPGIPEASGDALAARMKALQGKGGRNIYTGPLGDPNAPDTAGKSLLGR